MSDPRGIPAEQVLSRILRPAPAQPTPEPAPRPAPRRERKAAPPAPIVTDPVEDFERDADLFVAARRASVGAVKEVLGRDQRYADFEAQGRDLIRPATGEWIGFAVVVQRNLGGKGK